MSTIELVPELNGETYEAVRDACRPSSGVGSQFVFDEISQNLDQHKVKHVLWDKSVEDKLLADLFPSKRPDSNIFEPYLESHYRPIWVHDGVLLMERKHDDPAN